MKNIYRFREHHEKSVALLDLIEEAEARLRGDIDTYNHMQKMFDGKWAHKYEKLASIQFRKAVKQRLINYYHNYQAKYIAMIELGQLMDSKMQKTTA